MTIDRLTKRLPAITPSDDLVARTLERIDDERNGRLATDARDARLTHLVEQWMRDLVQEQRNMAHAALGYFGAAVAMGLVLVMVMHRQTEAPRPLVLTRAQLTAPVPDVGDGGAQLATLRRYLDHGQLPPASTVDASALVAYFEPVPANDDSLVVLRASSAPMPGATDKRLVRVTAVGASRPWSEHVPVSIVAIVDVADEAHLALAREAMRALTHELDADDQVAIVRGGRTPRVVASMDDVTPVIENSGADALALAYAAADNMSAAAKHVVVLTDGACDGFKAADTSTHFSVLRLGRWSPEHCAAPQLARATRGVYAQADNIDEAVQLFANPLRRTMLPVLRDPVLQVAATHPARPLGGSARATELAAGETMTAFFEVDADDELVARVDSPSASVATRVAGEGQTATRMSAAAASIGWALTAESAASASAHLEAAAELLSTAEAPSSGRQIELAALLTDVRSAMRTR
jgi:hypothetical protein